ncbi:MAG: glycosyltransferase family 39 protein, partial [Thermoanaerobaculia bacterium]
MSAAALPPPPRVGRTVVLAVLVVLLATVDTRSYGLIPDGKEMLSASAAVARFLEIGVSRDFVNALRRPAGDAVSRYGMGLSLAEAAPGAVTRVLRAAAPSVPSAPVFVLLPIACLAAAAWAATRALVRLGTPAGWAAASGAGLVFATPLWGYAASDYGEPLQVLCVALAALGVVELREDPASRRWQIVLGIAAGFAILTKTLLALAVAPLLLAAVFPRDGRSEEDFLESKRAEGSQRAIPAGQVRRAVRERARTQARRGGGAAPPRRRVPWPLLLSFSGILFLWSLFEFARFGKLLGGYTGETFSYPFFTGLLRLTVLPNKGLLWYAPITLLAPLGCVALFRRDARLALALAASPVALLLAASAWWAWDGQAGWGPRLLVPALPPLV